MISEPFKIKEVKHLPTLAPYERYNVLKRAGYNIFAVSSQAVTFDMVAQGMSPWSHFQKAGYMIGDEAYAGSRNYKRLLEVASRVLGLDRLVPTHNGIGAEKLLATTLVRPGATVPHNRAVCAGLVPAVGGMSVDVTQERVNQYEPPEQFGADLDLQRLTSLLRVEQGKVAYVHVVLCPEGWNRQPVSLANLEEVRELTRSADVPLVLDISSVLENALWIDRAAGREARHLMATARQLIELADVVLMDAAQDCRADVGGFITSRDDEIFERLRNQVVVFEGLHTYGGMTGRAMEVFATGIEEMETVEYTLWYEDQVEQLYQLIRQRGAPALRGVGCVGLDVARYLPHLQLDDYPKFVLAGSLFIVGGIRARPAGGSRFHLHGEGRRVLSLELPRHAYTCSQLAAIADAVATVYDSREQVHGLHLVSPQVEFPDQLRFAPSHHRLFVKLAASDNGARLFEPHKIAIFEPITILDKQQRRQAIERAGYNTFLLDSEDVYIDLLTDSGTTAMSCFQWEGMTNSTDTAYTSHHYQRLVDEFREILGFEHIIPTHQGRAAEHIMSQVLIKPGQWVPGNMYFTTTKLHQEMAGGVFADVIVDEAHDPASEHPFKGNIDLAKLQRAIDQAGEAGVAYVSFEMSVNMAGGQPFSMANARQVSALCQRHGIPLMYDATRCVENAQMIKLKESGYAHKKVAEILAELMSYGDGCTISCKKDFMVNMGGLLACNDNAMAEEFKRWLRVWEGDLTTGGLDPKDLEALRRGLEDSLDDRYIAFRIAQTQELGRKLIAAGIPVVQPPGSHAIFIDAKRFLPHLDQDEYPAQALAAAIYIETGVRAMERGNVSKGRNPETGENYRPALELVRLTIPRRVYSNSHFDFVVEGIRRLWEQREQISGLEMVYEPQVLRFFQGRFKPTQAWQF